MGAGIVKIDGGAVGLTAGFSAGAGGFSPVPSEGLKAGFGGPAAGAGAGATAGPAGGAETRGTAGAAGAAG